MSGEYAARWFQEDDLEAYIQGLNRNLYDEYDERVFHWKWRLNPHRLGFPPIVVVEHGSQGPVAFNSFLPLMVRRRGQVFPALQGCDGFVEKAHRRRGLFQLTLRFLEEHKAETGARFLMGFNLMEAAEAARKAGSLKAYAVDKCFLTPEGFKGGGDGVELVPSTVEEVHRLYTLWAEGAPLFSVDRSTAWLRWRVHQHPFKETRVYRVETQEGPTGYLVTDKVSEHGKTILTLNDYSPGLASNHLGPVVSALLEENPDATHLEVDTIHGGAWERAAQALGFKVTPWYQTIMKPLSGVSTRGGNLYLGRWRLNDISRWHLTEADIF